MATQHCSYSFTPDGKTIISGGGNGHLTAYGLDGKKIGDFVGHESDVWAVAPSPDGRYLVSGADDQTVRLWNLKTRELLVTIFRGEDGEWVVWTPEGFYTGSEGGAKLVGWQINQGPDKAAKYITAGQLRKALFRPDLVTAKILGDPDGLVKEAAAKLDIDALLNKSLAPEVAILSPADGAKLGEASVSVTARIADQGGGIGRISFRVNGQGCGFGLWRRDARQGWRDHPQLRPRHRRYGDRDRCRGQIRQRPIAAREDRGPRRSQGDQGRARSLRARHWRRPLSRHAQVAEIRRQ